MTKMMKLWKKIEHLKWDMRSQQNDCDNCPLYSLHFIDKITRHGLFIFQCIYIEKNEISQLRLKINLEVYDKFNVRNLRYRYRRSRQLSGTLIGPTGTSCGHRIARIVIAWENILHRVWGFWQFLTFGMRKYLAEFEVSDSFWHLA